MSFGANIEWLTTFDEKLAEAKDHGLKSFTINAPTDKFTKTISAGIIKNMMNLKIVGEKKATWKIVFTGKKPKNLNVTVIKLK